MTPEDKKISQWLRASVVASAVAIVGVGALFFLGQMPLAKSVDELKTRLHIVNGPNDDQPITMVGGSMYFSTPAGHYFVPDGHNQLKHSDASRYVDKVDVIDSGDNPTSYNYNQSATPTIVTIDVVYCTYTPPPGGSPPGTHGYCADTETVEFKTDSSGQNLTLASSGTHMDKSPQLTLDPTLYSHPRRGKEDLLDLRQRYC